MTRISESRGLAIYDYRCQIGVGAKPFVEQHDRSSISYVRKGSFGYRTRGRMYELVAGSVLVGRPGDEYVCTPRSRAAATNACRSSWRRSWSRRSAIAAASGAPAACRRCPS